MLSNLFVNLYVDFRLELPDIYEVRYGKLRVVEKMMESARKLQIFCKFIVKPLIPVKCRAVLLVGKSLFVDQAFPSVKQTAAIRIYHPPVVVCQKNPILYQLYFGIVYVKHLTMIFQ